MVPQDLSLHVLQQVIDRVDVGVGLKLNWSIPGFPGDHSFSG